MLYAAIYYMHKHGETCCLELCSAKTNNKKHLHKKIYLGWQENWIILCLGAICAVSSKERIRGMREDAGLDVYNTVLNAKLLSTRAARVMV